MYDVGLFSRGYNGDCRDCAYYHDNFHRSIYQDGYKCDYSGEYFDDQYGEQCHCFHDLAEVKAAEEKRTTRKCFKRNYFSQWHRAILEKDKLKIMLNGEKQYTLVDGGPIDIIEEKDGQYKCEVIMQGRSNFFLAPVNEIHRLNHDVWYLLETEDGKHGWIISKYVTLQ